MSVNVQIDLQGGEEFAQAMNRLDVQMQAQVQAKLAGWAETVKAEAQQIVPVRTGNLRNSIFARTQQWQTEVGAEAAYAAAIELGTFRARARPFLQPALEQHLPELEQVLLEAVDAAKGEAGL